MTGYFYIAFPFPAGIIKPMIVRRWLAPLIPNKKQIESLFEKDGLEYFEENFPAGSKIPEHRHPFDEIRILLKGQILYNISGNKVLLKPGDKIIVPSNTLHSKAITNEDCFSICAYQLPIK